MNDVLLRMISDIDDELKQLADHRATLISELKSKQVTEQLEQFKQWGISLGDYLIFVARADYGTHWSLAKAIKITEVDETHRYFDTVLSSYHESDYQYWVKTEESRIYFAELEQLEKDYHIYKVSEQAYEQVLKQFYNLNITYKDITAVSNLVASKAIAVIKE